MSRGIAHVTLVGNLSRDPELKQISTGTSVCDLGVAVGRSYKDAAGQWQDKTSFFNVKVWGAQGENCARYLSKGRQVAVDGRLEQRSWEAEDGSKRSAVDIIADTVMFLGGQNEGAAPASGGGGRSSRSSSAAPATGDSDFKDIDFNSTDDEDDIPF
ncbi:MAG: single-stranded DNA-binding protein [Thermoleophilia bacterium]|jgi:single-strand DNA-binding protein